MDYVDKCSHLNTKNRIEINLILLDITLQTITNTKLKKPDGKPFFQRSLEFLVKAVDDYPPIGQR